MREVGGLPILPGPLLTSPPRCKKHVNAEKRFSVHEAPVVLTVHLKRFSPMGRKIGHQVTYDEHLSLQPYMSEGQYGPGYSLYGVICHAGGGPNSGHYYAFVKSKDGRWHEMNDESVSPISSAPNRKSAYILFYLQNKGQRLQSALKSDMRPPFITPVKGGLAAGMKKRKATADADDEEEEEDKGTQLSNPFIGPVLPPSLEATPTASPAKRLKHDDPQADVVKKKIEEAKKTAALTSLSTLEAYASDSDETDKENVATSLAQLSPSRSSPPAPTPPQSSPTRSSPETPTSTAIQPANFYSTTGAAKAKKQHSSPAWVNKKHGFSPFSRVTTYRTKKVRGL